MSRFFRPPKSSKPTPLKDALAADLLRFGDGDDMKLFTPREVSAENHDRNSRELALSMMWDIAGATGAEPESHPVPAPMDPDVVKRLNKKAAYINYEDDENFIHDESTPRHRWSKRHNRPIIPPKVEPGSGRGNRNGRRSRSLLTGHSAAEMWMQLFEINERPQPASQKWTDEQIAGKMNHHFPAGKYKANQVYTAKDVRLARNNYNAGLLFPQRVILVDGKASALPRRPPSPPPILSSRYQRTEDGRVFVKIRGEPLKEYHVGVITL